MAQIQDSPAITYARWCVQPGNRQAPKYVKMQAAQWLEIADGKSDEAQLDEKAYNKVCNILKLMVHPDLGCSMYDGLEEYAWFLIVAALCTVCPDGRRYYKTALLEIARKNFKAIPHRKVGAILPEVI